MFCYTNVFHRVEVLNWFAWSWEKCVRLKIFECTNVIMSNQGNAFQIVGPFGRKLTDDRWIPLKNSQWWIFWRFFTVILNNNWTNSCVVGDLKRRGAHFNDKLQF